MGRSFWLLLAGQIISVLGDFLGGIAVSWLAYELTGSTVVMGTLYLVYWLPQAVVLIMGAPLVDRLDRRRLMMALDLIRCLTFALPILLFAMGQRSIWSLYVIELVAGAAGALFSPAMMSLLPSIVPPEQLVRANALQSGALQAVTLIGPALGGIIVAQAGSQTALLLDALSFLISSLTLLALPAVIGGASTAGATRRSYLKEVAEGFQFFGRVPALLTLALIAATTNIGILAINTLMIPFVRDVLQAGASTVGVVQSAWGIGYLLGATGMGLVGAIRARRRLFLMGCLLIQGGSIGALAFASSGGIPGVLILQALFGATSAAYGAVASLIYQRLVADRLRGRVMAVRMLLTQIAQPAGAFLGALLAARVSIQATFFAGGALVSLAALVGLCLPLLRALDGELAPLDLETSVAT